MRFDRTLQRTAEIVKRRPAVAGTVQRSAAPAPPSPARALQDRLGNRATQALIAQTVTPTVQRSAAVRAPVKVSSPNDRGEREAEETARKVMRMSEPAPVARSEAKGTVQRSAAASGASTAPAPASINLAGGSPLPTSVRRSMEPRFGASFANVRIHTGEAAARQSAALDAHAFTVGDHIAFGRDKFQPGTSSGQELISHELSHTIQQGAVIQRSVADAGAEPVVSERTSPHVQCSVLDIVSSLSPRRWIADKAGNIPGFTLLTVIIGYNPILNERVERNAGNILRGAIQLIPGGKNITDALNAHNVFDRASAWAAAQFEALKDFGEAIKQEIVNFISGVLSDIGGAWDRAKALVERAGGRVKSFAIGLANGIITLIKDAVLNPLAAYARTTSGYPLLCTVMGKDPITGETVPHDAETLLGAFMLFIGEGELFATMQKAKAIPRASAWFKDATKALRGFVGEIPGLFVKAFKSLEVIDIILIPRAFVKLAGVFGDFAKRFVSWGANAVWTLLEIIFDVVSPGALTYIKKTGAALRSILRNPLPFVGNLVKAAKLGFGNFGDHFFDHLKAGLIDWLTGSLPGIYIPKAFSLVEIGKFVFSVLGISWANIRQKLVKATSETAVKAMETGFDIVVALVRDGPAAAWDKIKEQLANLKDMVIGGITDFVVDMVVKKAIPKLVAMFIPGAGFVSAIVSIYDTIMVFVNKIKQIVAVVTGFIDSIVAIAGGAIGAAATRVENALAGVLSLAISFLAGFAGLGKVADKIMGVIGKVRATIDKALDWLVNWIVTGAKKLGRFVAQAGLPQDPKERLKLGMQAAVSAANRFAGKKVGALVLTPLLAGIRTRYGFKLLEVLPHGASWAIRGQINPETIAFTRVLVGTEQGVVTTRTVVDPPKVLVFEFSRFTAKQSVGTAEMTEGLHHHQVALNKLTLTQWLTNIYARPWVREDLKKERRQESDRLKKDLEKQIAAGYEAKGVALSKKQLELLVAKGHRGMHASHAVDAIAGGSIDEFAGFERGAVNSYVGNRWNNLRPELEAYARECRQLYGPADRDKITMNFQLRIKFLN